MDLGPFHFHSSHSVTNSVYSSFFLFFFRAELVIMLPADEVRALENPYVVTQYWNAVFTAYLKYAAVRPKSHRERYMIDVHTEAGLAHSGYGGARLTNARTHVVVLLSVLVPVVLRRFTERLFPASTPFPGTPLPAP